MELDIDAKKYRTGRLTAFQQFHIARKLAPALFALGKAAMKDEGQLSSMKDFDVLLAFGPLVEVISKMSEADTEYVLNVCLSTCQRQEGNAWAAVYTIGQRLMFEDIGLQAMLQLTVAVIRENLGNFFPAPPASTSPK
jgi:hypothetical protein